MINEESGGLGVIGMGLMGSALFSMTGAARGWDVDPGRCVNAASADEVIALCETVILSLPHAGVSREVLESALLRSGQIVIDTSTGAPGEMASLGRWLAERGVHYLDATISGNSEQVLGREVLVMAGGESSVFDHCRDLFSSFSRESVHLGPFGSGAKMKLVTNLVLGLNRAALAEGLVFADSLDLDPAQTLDLLRRGMSYSRIMDTKGGKMVNHDYTPQARLSQHLKDVRLIESATGLPLPLTNTHRQLLERAEALGYGEADNSAVIEAIRQS